MREQSYNHKVISLLLDIYIQDVYMISSLYVLSFYYTVIRK